MHRGALVPRQDRWHGRPCHVTGQQRRLSPRQPPTAPPYSRAMAIGATKSVSFEEKTVLDLKLVYKKC